MFPDPRRMRVTTLAAHGTGSHFPAHASLGHRGRKRISRLVTLPDYQGLGIGMRLAERVCEDQSTRGFRISIATSHPAVIGYCHSSPQWRPLGIKRLGGTRQRVAGRNVAGSTGRGVASFEWVGGKGSGL